MEIRRTEELAIGLNEMPGLAGKFGLAGKLRSKRWMQDQHRAR
jgi:hypothetical protein